MNDAWAQIRLLSCPVALIPTLHSHQHPLIRMSDENQSVIPRSFVNLFVPAGATKPRESRVVIAARYELCEDMAQMLTEHARMKQFELGVTAEDVLERVHRGLLVEGSVVETDEATWIVSRLAELLDWPIPSMPAEPQSRPAPMT